MGLNRELNVGADKAQRILEAAKGLFSSIGLKNTSIEEIATKAGLGKGTVYLYFKSKDEIFSTLASSFHQDLQAAIDDACSTPARATERLKAFIETRIRFWERSYREYGLTISSLYEVLSAPSNIVMREEYAKVDLQRIHSILMDGIAAGEFLLDNPERTAVVLCSMLDALSLPWDQDGSRVAADVMVDTYSAVLLNGLSLRAPHTQNEP
jgi:AcrR family transcriptional regulator